MKKRILSLVLALVYCFSLLPLLATKAHAADFDTTGWIWPVKATNAPSSASNRDLYCKTMYRAYYDGHQAIDITDYTGYTYAIRASKSGKVATVFSGCKNNNGAATGTSCYSTGCNPNDGYWYSGGVAYCNDGFGNGVIIEHDNGVDKSYYAHMTNVVVTQGQYVTAGQIIGYMGSTGNSTGKHLHFYIKHNFGSGFVVVNNNPIGDDIIVKNPSLWNKIDTIDYADEASESTPDYVDLGDDFYARIVNPYRNMYVTNDVDNVSLRSATGSENQIWFFDRQSNGSYLIRSAVNEKVLDVYDASTASGTNVHTYTLNRTNAQYWTIQGEPGCYYLGALCTTCVMDVKFAESTEGTNIWMYTPNYANAQQFDIEIIEDMSPYPQVVSDHKYYPLGDSVKLSWPFVPCSSRFWIDIKKWETNYHPVSENLYMSTSYTFTPTEPGEYTVYITGRMTDTSYRSAPYTFIVTDFPNSFTDVSKNDWFYDPVMWALENGITTGTSDTTFSPGDKCLRAHVVTFLWNAEKTPEPTAYTKTFPDVPAGAWYYKPVHWAVENGITSGVSDTKFGAGDICSRYQVVFFLWKAAGSPEPKTTVNPFTDVNPGHFFYKAVLWAVENEITSGTSATTFGPTAPCNRAQVVTFLYKAYA